MSTALKRKWTVQTDEGFLVVTATAERHFSVTGDLYMSEQAYQLGNEDAAIACGCLHDEACKAVPALREFIELHLSDVETGTPMHAVANSAYFLSGKAGKVSGDPETIEPAARTLRIPGGKARKLQEIARRHGHDFDRTVARYVGTFLAPVWAEQAAAFRAFLSEPSDAPLTDPSDEPTERYSVSLDGLTVESKCVREVDSTLVRGASCYQYAVKVTDDKGNAYRTVSWGSVHDYQRGHKDARGAAFGTLRELVSIYWDESDEFEAMILDGREPGEAPAETLRQLADLAKAREAAERMSDALLRNEHVIGH